MLPSIGSTKNLAKHTVPLKGKESGLSFCFNVIRAKGVVLSYLMHPSQVIFFFVEKHIFGILFITDGITKKAYDYPTPTS
jgi:hypothetical protein